MPIYSGQDVPNLYPDTRKRDGHWRYRRADGTFKSFQATEAKAITLALEANATQESAPLKIQPASSISIWIGKFIQYRQQLDPSLNGKQSWKNRQSALREFARVFSGTPTHAISLMLIRQWWDKQTPHAQRSKRPELNKLFNYLMMEGAVRLPSNPFSTADDKPRVMSRPVPKRSRTRLSIDQYRTISEAAPPFLRIAMAISLYTSMRRGDIAALRFDRHVADGYLAKQISKSHAAGIGANNRWELAKHPLLRETLAEARELALQCHACPFVLSRLPERRIMGEIKEHFAQVLPKMISDTFTETAKRFGIDGVTFHEVRALSAWIYRKAGHDQKLIQQMMAHSSGKMTEYYQAGHEIEWLDITIGLDSA